MKLLLSALLGLLTLAVPLSAGSQDDLDAFMRRVVARRDENWKKLQQYILDERERMEIRGPGNRPVWGEDRAFTWYLEDGFFVRSPVSVNGVQVAEPDRRKYETDFVRRARERDARRREGSADDDATAAEDVQRLIRQTQRPQFIDTAYFLKFTFEPGRYALVGRETFDGRSVLRIEYYPTRLFGHEQEMQQRRRELNESDVSRDRKAAFERMANRVALVTIWVDPSEHQIVKYTFDNVNLEFLPLAWLMHMDTARAVMTMSQPIDGVWLPRTVDMLVSATLPIGAFDVRYQLTYANYRAAETSSRFRAVGR